jgi:hypothetical protein
MLKAVAHGELRIAFLLRPIHRLQEKVAEVEMREARRFRPCLRKDEFEFVASIQNQIGSSLGTDTNPIHPAWWQSCPVRFDRYLEAKAMERSNEIIIKL